MEVFLKESPEEFLKDIPYDMLFEFPDPRIPGIISGLINHFCIGRTCFHDHDLNRKMFKALRLFVITASVVAKISGLDLTCQN